MPRSKVEEGSDLQNTARNQSGWQQAKTANRGQRDKHMAGSSCLGRWDLFEGGVQNKSRVTDGANATSYKKAPPETAKRMYFVGNQTNIETGYCDDNLGYCAMKKGRVPLVTTRWCRVTMRRC